ncbi:hypothetical protein HDE_11500 [Halotydeus destructor]|nr:hypothetical protein HDE_11500 [Halotydeus destructor]
MDDSNQSQAVNRSSAAASSSSSECEAMDTAVAPENFVDFLNTGRVGRRNAVPDIDGDSSARVSTADLPLEMEKLSCSSSKAGPSSDSTASTSGQAAGSQK